MDTQRNSPAMMVDRIARRCSECGGAVEGRRDRVTCSARCRMARSRRLGRATHKRFGHKDAPAVLDRIYSLNRTKPR